MRRIGLAVILILALAPLAAAAQQAGKVYRVGILGNIPAGDWDALIQGLREHGYVEGQNLHVERRYAEGQAARWPELASELLGLKVDIIVVSTTPAALAVRRASNTIPIVHVAAIDPVGAGLAGSLARPGGNVTGIATRASVSAPPTRRCRGSCAIDSRKASLGSALSRIVSG